MGLFNFFKKSGDKKVKEEENAPNPEEVRTENINLITQAVNDLGFDLKDFYVDLQGDTAIVFGEAASQEEKEKVVLAVGNTDGIATVDDRMTVAIPAPEAKFYEVKSGDSLSKIAKEMYGDAMKYTLIFEANKPMLKDPDKIYPGQSLRIPSLDA